MTPQRLTSLRALSLLFCLYVGCGLSRRLVSADESSRLIASLRHPHKKCFYSWISRDGLSVRNSLSTTTTVPRSQPAACSSSKSIATFLPRGGGRPNNSKGNNGPMSWLPWKSTPEKEYRRLLVEQRNLLDRQLKQAHEELLKLQKEQTQAAAVAQQAADTSSSSSSSKLNDQFHREQMRASRAHVTALEEEVRKLEAVRATLEKMLKQEQLKSQLMQSQLDKVRQATADMKEQYEKQLEQLRIEMEEQAVKQLAELRKIMEQRMEEALKAAKIVAEREKLEAVKEAEIRVQQQAEKQLVQEQKKSEHAVEKEKVKMRKLVKALAERERKLLEQAERQTTTTTTTRLTSSSSSSGTKATTSPGTVRGPLK